MNTWYGGDGGRGESLPDWYPIGKNGGRPVAFYRDRSNIVRQERMVQDIGEGNGSIEMIDYVIKALEKRYDKPIRGRDETYLFGPGKNLREALEYYSSILRDMNNPDAYRVLGNICQYSCYGYPTPTFLNKRVKRTISIYEDAARLGIAAYQMYTDLYQYFLYVICIGRVTIYYLIIIICVIIYLCLCTQYSTLNNNQP